MGTKDFHLLETLISNSQHMWFLFDNNLSIKYFNSSATLITGLSAEKIKGNDIGILNQAIKYDLKQSISDSVKKRLNYKNIGSLKITHLDNGLSYYLKVELYLIFRKGLFEHGVLLGENETHNVKLEQQLDLVNQKWRSTEKLAELGSWRFDIINDEQEWSRGMYDLYEIGFKDKPNNFDEFMQFIHHSDRHIFYDFIEELAHGQRPESYYDFRIITPSNSIKHIRCAIEVHFKDGKVVEITGVNQDVSDRVSIEQKDREISEMFQIAQRFSNMGTWRWSILTNEVSWSDNVYNIFEFDKSTFQPDYNSFLNTIPTDEKQGVINAINKCLEDNESYEAEHSIITKSGDRKWVREKGNVLRNPEGNATEMYGTITDISEAHTLKSELKNKEDLYQLLAESGQEWICLMKPSGEIIYSSPAVKHLLGYSEKDVINSRFSTLLSDKDQNHLRNFLNQMIENPSRKFSVRRKLKSKSGIFISCEINLQTLNDRKGNLSIRGLVKDISEQVKYEQKLAESNALLTDANTKYKEVNKALEETLEQLEAQTGFLNEVNKELSIKRDALDQTAIIVESDKNGNIIAVNDQFLKIAGYERSEILGKPHCIKYKSIFNSGVHDHQFFDTIWEHLNSKKIWRGEICNLNKQGRKFWLLKTVIPLVDSHGNVESFYSFSSDISLQKQKESELLLSKSAIEEAAAVKEEFLSVMSHEIRTPLNSVIGLTNLLAMRSPREDQEDIINTLKKSSDNLMYLVNDILDFNKIKSGKVLLDDKNFELSDTLKHLESSFREKAKEKRIYLQINEEFDSPLWLKGDINRLFQILNNVMHNAIKFTEEGEVTLTVKVQDSNFHDKTIGIDFQFSDTGIGIAKDQLKFLFVPFQQSEKHISRKYGGTGLGLSIVKGLIELLGGSIEVESTINQGSDFYINIPFIKAEDIEKESDEFDHLEERKSLKDYTILYVEDVVSNQMLIEELLKDFGAKCIVANDGAEAIDLTTKNKFDLILMDLQLPKSDGFTVTKQIRTQSNGANLNTPVLAFTAEPSSEELYLKIKRAGLQGCIHKPFDFNDLFEKIKTTITEKKSHKNRAELFNLTYYKHAFKNNPEKITKIRRLLIQDLTTLLNVIIDDNASKDEIREELHRINPIIKNIHCFELLELLDEYKNLVLTGSSTSILQKKIEHTITHIINAVKLD